MWKTPETKRYIAIPHKRPPAIWYAVPGYYPIEGALNEHLLDRYDQDIWEDGDSYVEGDHDLHSILPVNTPEEIRYAENYNGHQWVAVQRIARTLDDLGPMAQYWPRSHYEFRSVHHARRCLEEEGGVILDHRPMDGVCTVYTDVYTAAELRDHLGGMAYIESLAPSFDETNQP